MPGGMCLSSMECAGGYCDNKGTDGCAATCKAWIATGMACNPNDPLCDGAKDFCHSTNNVCTARVAAGAMCGTDARCQRNLFCLGMVATCVAPGKVGETCDTFLFGNDTCQTDLYCNDSVMPAVCETHKAAGADCDSYYACNDGLDCIGFDPNAGMTGKCGAWLDVGKTCDPMNYENGCPFDQVCDGMSLACAASGEKGSDCSAGGSDGRCRDGLYCDPMLKCSPTVAIGAACTPPVGNDPDPCHEGACDAMTMKCALVCM
jgi:hypothetical protein